MNRIFVALFLMVAMFSNCYTEENKYTKKHEFFVDNCKIVYYRYGKSYIPELSKTFNTEYIEIVYNGERFDSIVDSSRIIKVENDLIRKCLCITKKKSKWELYYERSMPVIVLIEPAIEKIKTKIVIYEDQE